MPEYLRKKGNRYLVRLPVPKHLWKVMGKRALVRSTGTGDLAEARRRRFGIIAELQADIDRAANADPALQAYLEERAAELREAVKRGELSPEVASDIMGMYRERHLKARGQSPEGYIPPDQLRQLQRASRYAFDTNYTPLTDHIKQYLKEREAIVVPSTLAQKTRQLKEFASWLQADPDVNDITRKDTGRYVGEKLVGNGKSVKTNRDTITDLSTFWNWMIKRGVYDHANPWTGLGQTLKESSRGGVRPEKRRWTDAELQTLFKSLPAGPKYYLRELSAVALYTGMRQNEIAELKVEDIDLDERVIHVREGKSRSAVRDVPVHSKLWPVIEQLIGERTSGYLFASFKPTGRDKLRGHEPSKRFGYWVRKHMPELIHTLPNKRTYAECDFHSFRRAFINACELAGIPEHTIKQLVGHTRNSMTYGTYSKGVSIELLREAIEKVDFPGVEV